MNLSQRLPLKLQVSMKNSRKKILPSENKVIKFHRANDSKLRRKKKQAATTKKHEILQMMGFQLKLDFDIITDVFRMCVSVLSEQNDRIEKYKLIRRKYHC